MATFFKLIPAKIYHEVIERHSETDGETDFKNGSSILWLGLDRFAEQDVKSLELNAAFLDQAEEIDELIYTHLDARLGRWDQVEIPQELLDANPDWPINQGTGKPLAPTYMFIACNPDTEQHWIWREFHPDSEKWKQENQNTHFFINMPSTSNEALSRENLEVMLKKDPVWVRRYVLGEWGYSEAQIHRVPQESIIEPTHEFLKNLIQKSILYRTYDHGESVPSCCLWHALYKDFHFVFREYYNIALITDHRRAIVDMSRGESYAGNYADPQIFKKLQQSQGGRTNTAQEFIDTKLTSAPPIVWLPADNNELGTRDRINTMLMLHKEVQHPVTGQFGAPKLYFCKKSPQNPNGCHNCIIQTQSQRRKKDGEVNGKPVWTDERERGIDHAYDPLRYGVAIHGRGKRDMVQKRDLPNSFNRFWGQTMGEKDLSQGYGIRF